MSKDAANKGAVSGGAVNEGAGSKDTMRFLAILDGTTATAERQARALAGFLCDGLSDAEDGGAFAGETLVFYADDHDRQRLVELAPTRDVRLVKVAPRRPDQMVAALTARARDGEIALFLATGGATGTELATRLACRAGGTVLTDALSIELREGLLHGRRNVYSNHLVGRFALSARPWCVTTDASWNDEPGDTALEHDILSDTDETGAPSSAGSAGPTAPPHLGGSAGPTGAPQAGETGAPAEAPFEDLELLAAPSAGDLAQSRLLVVAGYGAGSRAGVLRIKEAASRMGAGFGASRPVVMNAWATRERLIGVSGTRTAPLLCIVVGASGAPALYWGIEKAAFIVAINPDAAAPIVAGSDAAVLDDGVAVIEELAEIIAAQRGRD